MFSLLSMESSLSFTNVKIITTPTTSYVNGFRSLRAIKAINGIKAVTAVCVLFLIKLRWPKTKSLFQFSYFNRIAKLWNTLPESTRTLTSLKQFKSHLL